MLQTIPTAMVDDMDTDFLCVFILPRESFMGHDEADFSNVVVKIYNQEMRDVTSDHPHYVEYFCSGRLGSLHGGLLHLADARSHLTKEAVEQVQANVFAHIVHERQDQMLVQHEKYSAKRKRIDEGVRHLETRAEQMKQKAAEHANMAELWKQLWMKLLQLGEGGVDRGEQSWTQYLVGLCNNDESITQHFPPELADPDLTYPDLLMVVAHVAGKLRDQQKRAETLFTSAQRKGQHIKESNQKRLERSMKKIDEMVNGTEEKAESIKLLGSSNDMIYCTS